MKLKVANECEGLTRKPCGGEVGTEVQLKWAEQMRKKNGNSVHRQICQEGGGVSECKIRESLS